MNERTVHLANARAHREWWPKHAVSHFLRVENALWDAGLRVESDGGVTEEGEPWFGFFETESGEVVAHFARIDGQYVAYASFLNGPLIGRVLSDLVARFLACCPGKRVKAYNNSHSTPAA